MKNETDLYRTAVSLLEEAAQLIIRGKMKMAETLLFKMEEEVYEYAMDIYEQNDKNVDYFCSRFVFASLELDSSQRPSEEQIAEYWGSWFFWKGLDPHPLWVTIHERRYCTIQIELSLDVVRKKPKPKPTQPKKVKATLKPETKQPLPSAFQVALFNSFTPNLVYA